MFFFKSKKRERNVYFALDIGTEFVKSILYRKTDSIVEVIGVGKVKQRINGVKGGQITNIRSVVESVRSSLSIATNKYNGDIPIHCVTGLAGEMVKGVLVNANYDREKADEKISIDELKKVYEKIKKPSEEEAIKTFQEYTALEKPQIRLISSSLVESFIDGFRVDNPSDFSGKSMKLNIYSTYAPSVQVGAIESVCKQVGLSPLLIAAQPFTVARSVVGGRNEDFEAIIIDVGGGTTDVAVVKGGCLIDTHMFSFGGRVFTKRIAMDMNLNYERAEQMKIDYSKGVLDRGYSNIVKKSILKDISIWAHGIRLALEEFKDVELFPANILLCGGGSQLPEIREILIQYPFIDYLPFNRSPKVVFLNQENIDGIVDNMNLCNGIDMITPLSLARMSLDIDKFELLKGGKDA